MDINTTSPLLNFEGRNLQKLGSGSAKIADIEKAAKDFEAVFITEMLRPMFNEINLDPFNPKENSMEVYKSMLLDEYGKEISRTGGIGIAPHIVKELIKIQEIQGGSNL